MKTPKEICHEVANAMTIAHGMTRMFLDFHVKNSKNNAGAPPVERLEKIEKAVAALERAEKLLVQLREELRK